MIYWEAANRLSLPFECEIIFSPNAKTHDQAPSPAILFRPVRRLSDCVQLGHAHKLGLFCWRGIGRDTARPTATILGQATFWAVRFVLVGIRQFADSGGGRHPVAHTIFDIRSQRDLRMELSGCSNQLWLGVFLVQKWLAFGQNSEPRRITVLN